MTSAVIATRAQENTPGQTQPMDVSQPTEQLEQGVESQPSDQQHSQDTTPVGTAPQQPAEQMSAPHSDQPGTVSQDEMQERQRLRQEKSDKLTRTMLEVIYRSDIGIAPAADIINKAVLNFAIFASQFGQLSEAQASLPRYAEKCMKNHYDHYTKRAMMGYDDDQDLVDAVSLAHDMMPTLLPPAFAACIEQEEREVLAQSIELEIQRANCEKEREEAERLEAK